jgi:hypothetical protein
MPFETCPFCYDDNPSGLPDEQELVAHVMINHYSQYETQFILPMFNKER